MRRAGAASGVTILTLVVAAPSAESFSLVPGPHHAAALGVGRWRHGSLSSPAFAMGPLITRVHPMTGSGTPLLSGGRRGASLKGKAGFEKDDADGAEGKLVNIRSNVGKGAKLLRRLLDKLERKAEKLESKISSRLAKWEGGSLETRRSVRGMLAKAVESPYLIPVAAGACILAVPAAMTALAVFMIAAQISMMALSPLFILIRAAFSLAQPLILPRLLPALSLAMTASSGVSAGLLAKYPTSRTLPALSLGTILPILSWWIATIPQRSMQLVTLSGTMDPIRPFLTDPFFRPFLTDPFFRDLWQLLPRPVLFTTPTTVLIRKTSVLPYMEVKIALSVASLLVVAYCWYSNRREAFAFLEGGRSASILADAVEAGEEELEELEDEHKGRMLREWETRYKMRPEPGTDPRTWGTDELAYQMERAGLGGTCTTAFKKAGIDGRVALTLTAADEEEIRDELGVTRLGERKRLLLFLDDLRAAASAAPTGPPQPEEERMPQDGN